MSDVPEVGEMWRAKRGDRRVRVMDVSRRWATIRPLTPGGRASHKMLTHFLCEFEREETP